MAKSLNPMEAYRREQKKKEMKKHRAERQKDKQAKLSSMDPTELKEKLKHMERQVAAHPTDGPMRKRKQELEDTLRAVVKKQKEMANGERKKVMDTSQPMSIAEMTEANKKRFQNAENSIYYHPILNPFGAPPPGMPQRYRNISPEVPGPSRSRHEGQQGRPPPRCRNQAPRPNSNHDERGVQGMPSPFMQPSCLRTRRPGKRPPLPSGPPPPGTIQVPPRPPLPNGAIPIRPPPPPPPPSNQVAPSVVPPPPPMVRPPPPTDQVAPSMVRRPPPPPMLHQPAMTGEVHDAEVSLTPTEDDRYQQSVVAPYSTVQTFPTEEERKQAAERDARLRSLVPVSLRVQRTRPSARRSHAPPVPGPRPLVAPSVDPTTNTPTTGTSALAAFIEEVQPLL